MDFGTPTGLQSGIFASPTGTARSDRTDISTDANNIQDPDFILRNLDGLVTVGDDAPEERDLYHGFSHARSIIGAQALFYAGCCLELINEQKLVRGRKELAIGLIGCGNVGSFVLETLLQAGWTPEIMAISTREPTKAQRYKEMGLHIFADARDLVKVVRMVVIAVAPQHFVNLSSLLRGWIRPYMLVLSVMAGITSAKLSQALDLKFTLRTYVDILRTQDEVEELWGHRVGKVEITGETLETAARHMCAEGIDIGVLHFFEVLENCCVFLRIKKEDIRKLAMRITFGDYERERFLDAVHNPKFGRTQSNIETGRVSVRSMREGLATSRKKDGDQDGGFDGLSSDRRPKSAMKDSPFRDSFPNSTRRSSRSVSSAIVSGLKKTQSGSPLPRTETGTDNNWEGGLNSGRSSGDGSVDLTKKKKQYFDCANSQALATHRKIVAPVFHQVIAQNVPVSKLPRNTSGMFQLDFKLRPKLERASSRAEDSSGDKPEPSAGRQHQVVFNEGSMAVKRKDSFQDIQAIMEDPIAESLVTTPFRTARSSMGSLGDIKQQESDFDFMP